MDGAWNEYLQKVGRNSGVFQFKTFNKFEN